MGMAQMQMDGQYQEHRDVNDVVRDGVEPRTPRRREELEACDFPVAAVENARAPEQQGAGDRRPVGRDSEDPGAQEPDQQAARGDGVRRDCGPRQGQRDGNRDPPVESCQVSVGVLPQ